MSMKPASGVSLRAHTSLMCIGLMWVLPFLYYPHTYPLASFYQEWAAVLLGLCAMLLLAAQKEEQGGIPRIVLLPVGISLLILLQYPLGKGVYWGYSLMAALYLLWAAIMAAIGQRLCGKMGLPRLAAVLAAFLLLGAELSALLGMAQHFAWREFLLNLVSVKKSMGISGNLGQPNHYADYITLGLVSLGLLRTHWRMPTWQVSLFALPLLFVLVLSASRSAWLYLSCLTVMAWLWQRRDKETRQLLFYCLALLLGFGLMHLMVHLPGLSGPSGGTTSVDRLIEQGPAAWGGSGNSLRLHVWYEAWLIFTQHPLLGVGFGQFGWQHFLLGPTLQNASFTGRWDHAHNLVMQTAAEMGLAGLVVLFGTLAIWIQQARRTSITLYHWWGYSLLAVMGIHSLLEYPLWYAYFMGVAAFLMGALDTTRFRLRFSGLVMSVSWITVAVVGVLLLSILMLDYRKLQRLDAVIRITSEASSDSSRGIRLQQARDGLMDLQMQTLLRPYIEGSQLKAGWSQLDEGLALTDRRVRFLPENSTVYLKAILLARAGSQAEAREQMERAIWSFPAGFPVALEKLRTLASVDTDATRYPALLEFSIRKYEERQNGGRPVF